MNARDKNSGTVLMAAADRGDAGIVEMLLTKGADVNAKSNNGITVSMVAAKNGHNSIVELLKKDGAKE